ncbi:MAG: DUF3298 domain-containing protein [Trueperaceae bacterium]
MRSFLRINLFLAVLYGLAIAGAQGNANVSWRALYQGQLGDQAVTLDLALAADGRAFGRLTRAGMTNVLDGVGTHDAVDGTVELELRVASGLAPSVALDYAFLDAEYVDEAAAATDPVIAVLTGTRSIDWTDDGASLTTNLNYLEANAVEGTLTRTAQYAFGSLVEGRIDLSYAYPRFLAQHTALNALLAERATSRLGDWASEGRKIVDTADGLGWGWAHSESTDLVGAAADHLSLLTSFYYYTGGAHPNGHSESLLVRDNGDGLKTVALAELFAAGSDWRSQVLEWVLADLAEQGAEFVRNGDVTANDLELTTFTLGARGLTFHFDAYAVGPYVQGPFQVVVAYERLNPITAPGGALAAFAAEFAQD